MKSEARACPSCRRRLFPTRDGCWPLHMTGRAENWCSKSEKPVIAGVTV